MGHRQSGNIFFFLFGAVAVAGILGAAIQTYVMGPLKTASMVNKRNSAETDMQLSLRATAVAAIDAQGTPDCDSDGFVEPVPHLDAGANPRPAGGGIVPLSIGGAKKDPWGSDYGYCVWDHGPTVDDAGCGGAGQLRLRGTNSDQWTAITVISAGPNKQFEISCNDWVDTTPADSQPDTPLVNKPAGSDDIYYAWTYAEADGSGVGGGGGGLWTEVAVGEAEIEGYNLSVKDGSSVEQLGFDVTTKELTIGAGGAVRTDFIGLMTTANPSLELLDAISFPPEDGSGTEFHIRNPTGDSLQLTQEPVTATSGVHITPNGAIGVGTIPTTSWVGIEVFGDHKDIVIANTDNTAPGVAGDLTISRTRGTNGIVLNNDRLGGIRFSGREQNGGGLEIGAAIEAYVDGVPGLDDMPTRLEIQLAADGSGIAGAPEMIIKNNGFTGIGIGSSNPAALLDVGTAATMRMLLNNSVNTADSPYNLNMDNTNNFASRRFSLTSLDGTLQQAMVFGDGADIYTIFGISTSNNSGASWNPRFVIHGSGEVGIGTNNPAATLDVVGSIQFTGTITDVSDRSLKENIRPLENSLSKLMMLDGFAFEMKGDKDKKTEYGLIAQDVQKVFPELVRTVDDEGHLGVTYDGLIAPIIEAIKELKAENDALRKEIEALKAERAKE